MTEPAGCSDLSRVNYRFRLSIAGFVFVVALSVYLHSCSMAVAAGSMSGQVELRRAVILVQRLGCVSCIRALEGKLVALSGVVSASIALNPKGLTTVVYRTDKLKLAGITGLIHREKHEIGTLADEHIAFIPAPAVMSKADGELLLGDDKLTLQPLPVSFE